MLFQLHHVFWGPWKGLIKERRQRGKLQLGDRGGMMKQGKHSLGHLLIEGNTVCSKAMLILLLCHPQVHPLCSNAPVRISPRLLVSRQLEEQRLQPYISTDQGW